jgi:hypothetical protein
VKIRCALGIYLLKNEEIAAFLTPLRTGHDVGQAYFSKKPPAPLPLIKIYRISLILAGSISLDSTFKFPQKRRTTEFPLDQ